MSAPIKASHTIIALRPDTQIQEICVNFLSRGQDLGHVPPVHEVVGKGTGNAVVPGCEHRLAEKPGKLGRVHLARCHSKLSVMDLAEPGGMPVDDDIVGRIGNQEIGFCAVHKARSWLRRVSSRRKRGAYPAAIDHPKR
jgi:hypothetical protein